ncbi:MAG: ComEA family DNA-binding protein [Actinobacteria bacterium]|nr:ComEA family DNA-binding protein [Actinomycetota bacterium]
MNDHLLNLRNLFQDWYDGLQFSILHKRAFAIIAAIVLLTSALILTRGHSTPIVIAQPAAVTMVAPTLVVDVAGGVRKPGVYSLPANSRVTDAISAAGGARKGADTSEVNLARMVRDGEQIYLEPPVSATSPKFMPTTSSRSSNSSRTTRANGPININRASEKELESLPGIGPVLALKIFTYRNVNGPFTRIEDLQKVSGIGSAKFAALKTKVRV